MQLCFIGTNAWLKARILFTMFTLDRAWMDVYNIWPTYSWNGRFDSVREGGDVDGSPAWGAKRDGREQQQTNP